MCAITQARKDGYEYHWADMCCIAKRHSAELQEAINSMFLWYQEAEICYAYLSDLSAGDDPWNFDAPFNRCRWFRREWTLQQLLAPIRVEFFNCDWQSVGSKEHLSSVISKATGISSDILCDEVSLESASVAQRMSWAAGRKNKRPEDKAYCLMGLYQVNMGMLYGEGAANTFLRLQEEFMRNTSDLTLFAWKDPRLISSVHGLLAVNPDAFGYEGVEHVACYYHTEVTQPTDFGMTYRGLEINLLLVLDKSRHWPNEVYWASLDCPDPKTMTGFLGIRLWVSDPQNHEFKRVDCNKLFSRCSRGTATISTTTPILVRHAVLARSARWAFANVVHFHTQASTEDRRIIYRADGLNIDPFSERSASHGSETSDPHHHMYMYAAKVQVFFKQRDQFGVALYFNSKGRAFMALLVYNGDLEPVHAIVEVPGANTAMSMIESCFATVLASGSSVKPEPSALAGIIVTFGSNTRGYIFQIFVPSGRHSTNNEPGGRSEGKLSSRSENNTSETKDMEPSDSSPVGVISKARRDSMLYSVTKRMRR